MAVMSGIFGPTWGDNPNLKTYPEPIVPGMSGTWGGLSSWGGWQGGRPFQKPKRKPPKVGGAKLALATTAASYMDMLNKQQQDVLSKMLADSQKQRQGQLASLAGFGAALQGYSHDLWGQTDQTYRDAAAAQQSMAQGLGGQVGSGVAGMRAQEASLAGQLGYSGGTPLPTAEAAAAQVGSEGGAKTGEMMGQVGTAWGGYGATRPEYIGFMTGQNQMQLEREGLQSDKDVRLEFAKLAMDNPKTAQEMYLADQENKRQTLSSTLAQQTLKTNIAMQRAKLQQAWYTARANAKDDAARRRIDAAYKSQKLVLDQQQNTIDQQNADASTTRAGASVTSANASMSRADTAWWKSQHPSASGTPQKYSGGSYQQKIASSLYNAPKLFGESGRADPKQRADFAFNTLWPQMAPFVDAKNRKKAQALLRQRLINASKKYKLKVSGGGGGDY